MECRQLCTKRVSYYEKNEGGGWGLITSSPVHTRNVCTSNHHRISNVSTARHKDGMAVHRQIFIPGSLNVEREKGQSVYMGEKVR